MQQVAFAILVSAIRYKTRFENAITVRESLKGHVGDNANIPIRAIEKGGLGGCVFLSNYCLFVSNIKSFSSPNCIPVINFFPRL